MRKYSKSKAMALVGSLALLMSSCAAANDESTSPEEIAKVVFAQPTPQSVIFWPGYVADQLGYFEEEGIEFELAPASESLSMAAFVTNGSALMSTPGASEVLFAAREGAEISVLMDWWTNAAEGIVAPEGSPINSVADLEGLTVGVVSEEDETFLTTALAFFDLSLQDVDTVITGEGGGSVANALRNGEIDAFAGAVFDFAALRAAGVELKEITPENLVNTPAASLTVSDEQLSENREVIVGLLRAYAKATYAGVYDPDALQAMSMAAVPDEWQDEEAGRALLDAVVGRVMPDDNDLIGQIRPDVWELSQQQLIAAGELEAEQDLSEILDGSLVEEANDWDRAEVEAEVAAWLEANQ